MQKFWHHAVAITDLVNPKTPPTVKYLYGVYDPTGKKLIGPVTYNNTSQISPPAFRVVSVNDLYHRQMSQADLNKLALCDRALLDASAYWAYNRAFQPGDYLVLIAMHIMTKEQPDWVFSRSGIDPTRTSLISADIAVAGPRISVTRHSSIIFLPPPMARPKGKGTKIITLHPTPNRMRISGQPLHRIGCVASNYH